jgi:Zn-dependent protease with chaperone function
VNAALAAAVAALVLFAVAGPRLAASLPPAVTVRVLGPASVLAAGCGAFVLAVVTFTWLAQLAQVADRGTWSADTLRVLDPVPKQVSVAAGFLLLPVTVCTIWTVAGRIRALWRMRQACRHLPPVRAALYSVVDSDTVDAFTTPYGHIILTSGMLAALSTTQRRIVLAHERSHRRHGHTWWALAVDLAAAVNPLLRPTAAAIRHATERWADEEAARVADRRTVAVTIANVAMLRSASRPGPVMASAASGGRVPQRVRALLDPPPRTRARLVGIAVVLTLSVVVATFAVLQAAETLFELAMQ